MWGCFLILYIKLRPSQRQLSSLRLPSWGIVFSQGYEDGKVIFKVTEVAVLVFECTKRINCFCIIAIVLNPGIIIFWRYANDLT